MSNKKKTIVFFMFPYWGHVIPHINLLNTIKKQGFEVICFCSEKFLELLKNIGMTMYSYPEEVLAYYVENEKKIKIGKDIIKPKETPAVKEYKKETMDAVAYFNEMSVKTAYDSLIFKSMELDPCLILFDSYAQWGLLIAKKLAVPAFCMESATVIDEKDEVFKDYIEHMLMPNGDFYWTIDQYVLYQKKLNRHYEKSVKAYAGIEKSVKLLPDKTFVYESDSFHRGYSSGHLEVECLGYRIEEGKPAGKKNGIFMTRGTMNRSNEMELFCKIVKLLNGYEGKVLATLGDKNGQLNLVEERLDQWQDNKIEIAGFVNQIEQLAAHELFICHGGVSGVREAIMCETPVIIIPRNYHCYQVGKAIEKLKIGIMILETQLNEKTLLGAIHEIINNDVYRENIVLCKEELNSASRNNIFMESVYEAAGVAFK